MIINNIGHRLKRGFSWALLGTIAWRLLSALSSIVVARILTPSGFGELGIIRNTASLFMVYAGFRLGATASKHVAQFRETDLKRTLRVIKFTLIVSAIFCGIAAIALLIGAPYFAEKYGNKNLILPLRLISIFLFFQIYSLVYESVLAGLENFRAIARANMYKGIFLFITIIPSAYYFGVNGAVIALGVSSLLSFIVVRRVARKAIKKYSKNEIVPFVEWKKEFPLLWTFALPGLLVGVLTVTMTWVGNVMLVGGKGGYVEFGLFEAANQWRTMILFLPGVFSTVVLPVLAHAYGRAENKKFYYAVEIQFKMVLVVILPMTVVAIELSPILIKLFGAEYKGALDIMPSLMGSVFFYAMNQSLRKVQDSCDKRWQNFLIYALWAIVFYLVVDTLVPLYGAVGLANAYIVAEMFLFAIQAWYVERRVAVGSITKNSAMLMYSLVTIGLVLHKNEIEEKLHMALIILGSFVPLAYLMYKNRAYRSVA